MDSSLRGGKGIDRFQRKVLESSFTSSFTLNTSLGIFNTSLKRSGDPLTRKTPSKTPRKSPGRLGGGGSKDGTPGRKTPGDRFIPNRSNMDLEAAHYKIMKEGVHENEQEMMSPSKREYQRVLQENLNIQDTSTTRILAYNTKAPIPSDGYANNMKVLYSASKPIDSARKTTRHIPQDAERILDAPDLLNDYYLNLVDWSCNNHLAVALGAHVYIWNAISGSITPLLSMEGDDYVCSVRWIAEGNYLAVGSSSGEVQLWDVERAKRSRVMTGHSSRVSSLAWNQYILSSGSRDGSILHSDVRVADFLVGRSDAHTQEVCGLEWSPDGRFLASGGNDNLLCVWSSTAGDCHAGSTPHLTLTQHQAAVRALAWCPWQPGVLASGGGTSDRCIKIWNCQNGTMINSLDTKSQVCSLVWNTEYKELASSHGYPSNEINIWKYPSMTKIAELTGHTERVLHLCLSPDTSTLLSAGADETLRLWKCFPVIKKKETKAKQAVSGLRMSIR
ncbi:cell division cycle protein 20 homolog isoform X2 [Eurytemora carolleeae]|uniref:cell division cycle protein 20 homolog isoform X2 n=1 Tax=Eurytemora carolleeae TaxID=1294199 RepID=UPI000C784BAC|nr:cell division cycle protein 20 homolog isoform X2 [Eurytemora carolleeae]|eukprot:XP_023339199.1 cell division cycle protein 20 homolog isoform X2 [Eurytemora affinis]